MTDWIQSVERALARSKGLPAVIDRAFTKVREEVAADKVRRPTFPIELVWQTALYLDVQGRQRARFHLDFPDVTKATDGTDISIQRYELWGRDETPNILTLTTPAVPGLAQPGITLPGLVDTPWNLDLTPETQWMSVSQNTESFFRTDGFLPGSTWRFRARAIGTNLVTPGDWSSEIIVTMAEDTTPPPQPTAPVVTAERGVLTVRWDGQSVNGPMPADFKYAVLAQGSASSPTTEITRFGRMGGFTVVADLDYYDPQFFRLQAVDESGNLGPWSEQGVGFTTPLVDTDVILSEIDAAKTHLINVDAGVSILDDTIVTKHLLVTEDMTAALAQFLKVKAGMMEVNEIWADEAWLGVADAKLVRSDMFVGKTFEGGTFTGSFFQTNVEDYTGIKMGPTGIRGYSQGGQETFNVSAANGSVTAVGRHYTSVAGDPGIAIVPPADAWNGQDMGVWFAHDSHYLPGLVTAGIWMADPGPSAVRNLNIRGANEGGVTIWNGLNLLGTDATISADREIRLTSLVNLTLNPGDTNHVRFLNGTGAYDRTIGSSANMVMHTDGNIFKSTSSRRYKTDIQDWDPGMKGLGLRPRTWTNREQIPGVDVTERYVGFIAEEVQEILPELVIFDEEGRADALSYDRFPAAIIPILVEFHHQLNDIRSRLQIGGL